MAESPDDEGLVRHGPRTAAGLERCRQARWKHGKRSAAAIAARKARVEATRRLLRELAMIESELAELFACER